MKPCTEGSDSHAQLPGQCFRLQKLPNQGPLAAKLQSGPKVKHGDPRLDGLPCYELDSQLLQRIPPLLLMMLQPPRTLVSPLLVLMLFLLRLTHTAINGTESLTYLPTYLAS